MRVQVRQIEILKIVFSTFGGWTRIWFLMCKRLYCRLPSILPRRQCQGRFFSYLNDKRWPDALVSFRYSCWSLLLLLSSLSLSLSLSRRLLNLLDMRRTTKRWHSVGWSVGPALIGQAGKETPHIFRKLPDPDGLTVLFGVWFVLGEWSHFICYPYWSDYTPFSKNMLDNRETVRNMGHTVDRDSAYRVFLK